MLSKDDLEMISPYGYRTLLVDCIDMGEFYRTTLEFQHKGTDKIPFRLELDLPRANGPHLIIEGVERTVLPSVTEVGLRSRTETLRNMLHKALERALCDFVHNGAPVPSPEVVMAEFKALVARSEFIVDTPPHSPLEKEGYEQMIRIDRVEGNPVQTNWREFRLSDWGKVDPNSTSQSTKINRVFRRANNKHSMCETIGGNTVFAQANPRRTFLTRTAFERHLPQLVPETSPVVNEKNKLSGKTLLTALMDLGNTTFEDSIAVSRSAAAAMTCVRTIRQTWVGNKPLELQIPVDTYVQPKCLIAKSTDGEEGVHADKLFYPAKFIGMKVTPTLKFRHPALRYVFTFEAELPIRNGDKISGRHGNKGIAWIVEDKDMPVMRNPDHQRMHMMVDICLSPISVVKRRMMSLYLEGMVAKKAISEGRQIVVPGWEIPEEFTFEKLVEEGWGGKDQLHLGRLPLPEKTFVAPLFWLRLDKIAVEQVSVSAGSVVVNHLGFPIDSARINGQKRDVSKSLAFYHKPIHGIMKNTIRRNTLGVRKCEAVIQILEPGFSLTNLLQKEV